MKQIAIATAIVVGVIYLITQALYPSVTHRYRLTRVADDNGKPVIGSAVIEASYWKKSQFMGSHGEYGSSARGEAVVLDFGDKGLLFALLKGDDMHSDANWIVRTAFGIERRSPPDEELRELRTLTGKKALSFAKLPILVRFRDTTDPKSVERVDPDNLAASYGPGVTLIKATIEIVPSGVWPFSAFGLSGTPITTGIINRLTWLNSDIARYPRWLELPENSRVAINGLRLGI